MPRDTPMSLRHAIATFEAFRFWSGRNYTRHQSLVTAVQDVAQRKDVSPEVREALTLAVGTLGPLAPPSSE